MKRILNWLKRKGFYLKLTGFFGKKVMIESHLQPCPFSETEIIDIEKCKSDLLEYKKKYKEIQVHSLWSERIGEYLTGWAIALKDSKFSPGVMHLFVLTNYVDCNMAVTKILSRTINIVLPETKKYWMKILNSFPHVNYEKFYYYMGDNRCRYKIESKCISQYIRLTEDEEKYAKAKVKKIGIDGEYVCISNRDRAYLEYLYPSIIDNTSYYNGAMSFDADSLREAIAFLREKGIKSVRMGRIVEKRLTLNGCIDYASDYYDELLDLYLPMHAKFCLESMCGINLLVNVTTTPLALYNVVLFHVLPGIPQCETNLYILLKYFSKDKNRYLTLREILDLCSKGYVLVQPEYFQELNIVPVGNNQEEILDLAKEINGRIDGDWQDTEEMKAKRHVYNNMLQYYYKKNWMDEHQLQKGNIGGLFLLKNDFLLTKEDILEFGS